MGKLGRTLHSECVHLPCLLGHRYDGLLDVSCGHAGGGTPQAGDFVQYCVVALVSDANQYRHRESACQASHIVTVELI
ncbi:hypothetical protein D3C72_1785670 [compost metagenome]